MRAIYLLMAVLGAIIPYVFFIHHFNSVGFDLSDFVSALFVNGAAGGFSADLVITSAVFWLFMFTEKRIKRPWGLIVINLAIGLSCALPLYLYLREKK